MARNKLGKIKQFIFRRHAIYILFGTIVLLILVAYGLFRFLVYYYKEPIKKYSNQVITTPLEKEIIWQPAFKGIDLFYWHRQNPAFAVYAARIDITIPGISFCVTPEDPKHPGKTRSLKTSSFLMQQKCQIAINAAPFEPRPFIENRLTDILGFAMNNGRIYSSSFNHNGALLFDKEGHPTISYPPFEADHYVMAVPGYQIVLENGKNMGLIRKREPRTLVGYDLNRHYLFLLVIDGLDAKHSIGSTTYEAAAWIKALGANTALNLDGGGSVTMAMDNGKGSFRLINRARNWLFLLDGERVVGSHFGIFADALP